MATVEAPSGAGAAFVVSIRSLATVPGHHGSPGCEQEALPGAAGKGDCAPGPSPGWERWGETGPKILTPQNPQTLKPPDPKTLDLKTPQTQPSAPHPPEGRGAWVPQRMRNAALIYLLNPFEIFLFYLFFSPFLTPCPR